MAPTHSRPIAEHTVKRKRLNAPIQLQRPEKPELVKGQYITLKLRSTPAEAASTTYDLPLPYFGSGTPEEWLRFKRNLYKVIVGQNLTTGPLKYTVTRRVLEGDALAAFDASAEILGNETNDNFVLALAALTEHIFPARALQTQKRYMRRYLRKPADVSIREHVARVIEINKLIEQFPPMREGGNAVALPDDELLDLLEFGCPNSWQKAMLLQDFDPVDHTVQEFVRFCERLESTEDKPIPKKKNTEKVQDEKKTQHKQKRKRQQGDARRESSGKGTNCLLHGSDCGHGTDDCYSLKAQAKRMKNTYDAQAPDKKQGYKKKQEMHALIAEAVEQAMNKPSKKTDKKTTKKRVRVSESSDEEHYHFDTPEKESDNDSEAE